MTENISLVSHPELKLEDVREGYGANECTGRGGSTAAARGYNAERLANAVLDTDIAFILFPRRISWFDTFVSIEGKIAIRIECKSCIYRYPSGAFGRFKIWKDNHKKLVTTADSWSRNDAFIYFFVVYTVEDNIEKEVGKLVAPVKQVDDVLDGWTMRDHPSMGKQEARDISWNLLIKKLGVTRDELKRKDIVDLTE